MNLFNSFFSIFTLSVLLLSSCQPANESVKKEGLSEEQRKKILIGIYGDSTLINEKLSNSSEELFNQIELGDSEDEVSHILSDYESKSFSKGIYSGFEYEGMEFLGIPGSFKLSQYGKNKKIKIKEFEFEWKNHKSMMTKDEFFKNVTKIIRYVDSSCEVMTGAKLPGIDAGLSTDKVLIGGGAIQWKNQGIKHQIRLIRVAFGSADLLTCNYTIER